MLATNRMEKSSDLGIAPMKRPVLLPGLILVLAISLAACGGKQIVDEAVSGTVIGRIQKSALGPGKSASATFDLAPGKYALICNRPGHYQEGMYTAFELVDEAGSEGKAVSVELGEWFVKADRSSDASGAVTFTVSNKGGKDHEFVIIQTNLAPDALVVQ